MGWKFHSIDLEKLLVADVRSTGLVLNPAIEASEGFVWTVGSVEVWSWHPDADHKEMIKCICRLHLNVQYILGLKKYDTFLCIGITFSKLQSDRKKAKLLEKFWLSVNYGLYRYPILEYQRSILFSKFLQMLLRFSGMNLLALLAILHYPCIHLGKEMRYFLFYKIAQEGTSTAITSSRFPGLPVGTYVGIHEVIIQLIQERTGGGWKVRERLILFECGFLLELLSV